MCNNFFPCEPSFSRKTTSKSVESAASQTRRLSGSQPRDALHFQTPFSPKRYVVRENLTPHFRAIFDHRISPYKRKLLNVRLKRYLSRFRRFPLGFRARTRLRSLGSSITQCRSLKNVAASVFEWTAVNVLRWGHGRYNDETRLTAPVWAERALALVTAS